MTFRFMVHGGSAHLDFFQITRVQFLFVMTKNPDIKIAPVVHNTSLMYNLTTRKE